jgi:hypothetical protein
MDISPAGRTQSSHQGKHDVGVMTQAGHKAGRHRQADSFDRTKAGRAQVTGHSQDTCTVQCYTTQWSRVPALNNR